MPIDTFTAISLNGMINEGQKNSSFIFQRLSNHEILKFRNQIRDSYDAILVGGNTILADNPDLLNSNSTNKRVIIDLHNNFPFNLKIFANKPQNTVLLTKRKVEKSSYYDKLSGLGVNMLFMDTPNNPNEVVKELEKLNLKSILIEGGPKTINQFLETNLINSLQVIVFPILIGVGQNLYDRTKNHSLKLMENKMIDKKYLFLRYSLEL